MAMGFSMQSRNSTKPRGLNEFAVKPLLAAWSDGNDQGAGYAIGQEGQTPYEAAVEAGLTVIHVTEDGIAIAEGVLGGYTVIAPGPWAVDVPDSEEE